MHWPSSSELLQALFSGIWLGATFALMALGLSLVLGFVRVVNLMHGELVVLGAFVTYAIGRHTHLQPLIAAVIAMAAVGGLALLMERYLLRPIRHHGEEASLLTTFALSIVLQNAILLYFGGNTRAIDAGSWNQRLQIHTLSLSAVDLLTFGVTLGIFLGAGAWLRYSNLGRQARAGAQDPLAAQVVGVPVARLQTLIFGAGAALSALGGALYGMTFSFTPNSSIDYLLTSFAVVIFGGVGSLVGTLVGGLCLGLVESLTSLWLGDGYRVLSALVVFLVFLLWRPQGFFGRMA